MNDESSRPEHEGVTILDVEGGDEDLLDATYLALKAGAMKLIFNLEKLRAEDPGVLALAVDMVRDRGGEVKLLNTPVVRGEYALPKGVEVYANKDEALASFAEAAGEPEPAGPTVTENGGVELVQVPAGSFSMGSPETEEGRSSRESPQHEVTLPAFEIGKYTVTNEEYGRYLEANPDKDKPRKWTREGYNQARQPVVASWHQAKTFAEWAGCRLPSEAEWEYAARSGTTEPYLEGATEEVLGRFAWYRKNSERKLQLVGEKEANAWGLHDVLGNVWEWVEDAYHNKYDNAPENGDAWVKDPLGATRVLRGGYYGDESRGLRVACRDHDVPSEVFGFRVVRSRS